MGNSSSTDDKGGGDENTSTENDSQKVGYRVLGVQPQSPTSYCGLVAHFDFIVAANGVPLKTLDTTFIELIKVSNFPRQKAIMT